MSGVRADEKFTMTWPWEGHEQCGAVHLFRIDGKVAGRVCKRCNTIEHHLLVDPGMPIESTGTIDVEPVGSA